MFNIFDKNHLYERKLKKLKKQYPFEESKEYKQLKTELDFEYGKIDEYTKFKQLIESEYENDDKEKRIKLIELDKKYNKIDDLEYEKQLNDINQNPWAKIHFDYNEKDDPGNIGVEIVYNDYFIRKLEEQGYTGTSNDDIVQSWLGHVFAANVDITDLDLDEEDKKEYVTKKKVDGKFIIG